MTPTPAILFSDNFAVRTYSSQCFLCDERDRDNLPQRHEDCENGRGRQQKAKQVLKLTADSSGFLSTIQIGVTLAGFLTSASASQTFVDMLSGAIGKISFLSGIPAGVINGFSVVVITLITSYFSLVLGELAPKRIAMQAPEKVSFKVVGILLGFKKITKPFVKYSPCRPTVSSVCWATIRTLRRSP